MVKKGLGRGLDALLVQNEIDDVVEGSKYNESVVNFDIKKLLPSIKQPRSEFNEEKLNELADSIREHGIIQPLVVRKINDDNYQIIVGERRLRAAKIAGLTSIPCIVKEYDDAIVSELALIENIQRENLSALEESVAFQRMMKEYGYTQGQLAKKLGKSRSYIANSLRLQGLSEFAKDYLISGDISAGHARAILSVNDDDNRNLLVEEIVKQSLSVRQAEEMAKRLNESSDVGSSDNNIFAKNKLSKAVISQYQKELEDRMRNHLGTKIKFRNKGEGGRIEIDYYSEEDLNRILSMIIPEDEI